MYVECKSYSIVHMFIMYCIDLFVYVLIWYEIIRLNIIAIYIENVYLILVLRNLNITTLSYNCIEVNTNICTNIFNRIDISSSLMRDLKIPWEKYSQTGNYGISEQMSTHFWIKPLWTIARRGVLALPEPEAVVWL